MRILELIQVEHYDNEMSAKLLLCDGSSSVAGDEVFKYYSISGVKVHITIRTANARSRAESRTIKSRQ